MKHRLLKLISPGLIITLLFQQLASANPCEVNSLRPRAARERVAPSDMAPSAAKSLQASPMPPAQTEPQASQEGQEPPQERPTQESGMPVVKGKTATVLKYMLGIIGSAEKEAATFLRNNKKAKKELARLKKSIAKALQALEKTDPDEAYESLRYVFSFLMTFILQPCMDNASDDLKDAIKQAIELQESSLEVFMNEIKEAYPVYACYVALHLCVIKLHNASVPLILGIERTDMAVIIKEEFDSFARVLLDVAGYLQEAFKNKRDENKVLRKTAANIDSWSKKIVYFIGRTSDWLTYPRSSYARFDASLVRDGGPFSKIQEILNTLRDDLIHRALAATKSATGSVASARRKPKPEPPFGKANYMYEPEDMNSDGMPDLTGPQEWPAQAGEIRKLSNAPLEATQTVAEKLVECLEKEGVEYVFGIPGGEVMHIMDALRRSKKIKFILTADERGAAFMANVYRRLSEKPAVCLTTLGPGATNAVTGVADAYLDKVPMLVITGQTPSTIPKMEEHQQLDLEKLFTGITKFSYEMKRSDNIEEIVRTAFDISATPRRGPAVIILPQDIAAMRIKREDRQASREKQTRFSFIETEETDDSEINRIADMIKAAKYPVIIAGDSLLRVDRERSSKALTDLVEEHCIPITMTYMGKGCVSTESRWSLPPINGPNDSSAQFLREHADLIIAIGYDTVECNPSVWNPAGDKKIINIDFVPAIKRKAFRPAAQLTGYDLKSNLDALNRALGDYQTSSDMDHQIRIIRAVHTEALLRERSDNSFPINPVRVIAEIREILGKDDILISDVGKHKMLIGEHYPVYSPRTAVVFNGLAPMGGALPGAIGAKLAYPDRKVAAICGDGGFWMSVNELETARRLQLPLVIIVMEDKALGLVKEKQVGIFGKDGVFGTELDTGLDLAQVAKGFGAEVFRVGKSGELTEILKQAFTNADTLHKPHVVIVPVSYDKSVTGLGKITPSSEDNGLEGGGKARADDKPEESAYYEGHTPRTQYPREASSHGATVGAAGKVQEWPSPRNHEGVYKALRAIWNHVNFLPVIAIAIMQRVYTPHVGDIAVIIRDNPERFDEFVHIENDPDTHLWIVTNGKATLGIGDTGCRAAGAVMEGKQALFKWFGGVKANILLVDTSEGEADADNIVSECLGLRKEKGKILLMLEDIPAPVCFKVEKRLNAAGIPTIHDDQHGTAIVIAAGVINALKTAGKDPKDSKVVISGAGASGTAMALLLNELGIGNIICLDSQGPIYIGRHDLTREKETLSRFNKSHFVGLDKPGVRTKEDQIKELSGALKEADGFIGLARPDLYKGHEDMLRAMKNGSFVFACSNPNPEFDIEKIIRQKKQGDFANIQFLGCGKYGISGISTLNNCYAFPGLYRALSDLSREGRLKSGLKQDDILAISKKTALALAGLTTKEELARGIVLPATFLGNDYNLIITQTVANTVADHFGETGKYPHLAEELATEHRKLLESLSDEDTKLLMSLANSAPAAPTKGEASLIGKWMPTSDIEFMEHEGCIRFMAYDITDPDRKEIEIKINAKRAPPSTFDNPLEIGIKEIDEAVKRANKEIRQERRFILEPNQYGINGIGIPQDSHFTETLAIAEPLAADRLAKFHELAHASDITVNRITHYIDGGKAALNAYINEQGRVYRQIPGMREHYALRLLQGERCSEEDEALHAIIKQLDVETSQRPSKVSRASPAGADGKLGNLGNATVAFRLMNAGILGIKAKEDINIMVTYKCPFSCAHCLAVHAKEEGKGKDAPKETLFSIFDELKGFKKVHIVGTGEPLAYGKEDPLTGGVSQDFLDVVRYAAERVEEVRIVTNGYLIPEDLEEAREFFAQFPPNVVWLVSVDKFHAEQMKNRTNKSLKKIVDTMEYLASQKMIKTAYNVRIETNETSMPVLESFGLSGKLVADRANLFINRVQSIGSAAVHHLEGIPLRIDDISRHGYDPAKFFLFIDPDGYVLTSDHIAYMTVKQKQEYLERRQEGWLFVLGNINKHPFADVILERLFFFNMSGRPNGYFDDVRNRLRPYHITLLSEGSLATVDIKGSWKELWQSVFKALYFYSTGDTERAKKLMANFDNNPQPIKHAIADILYYLFIYSRYPKLADIIEDFINQCINPDWMIQADIGLSFSDAFRVLDCQKSHYQVLDSTISCDERRTWSGIPKRWIREGSSFCPVYEISSLSIPTVKLRIWPIIEDKVTIAGSILGYYRDIHQGHTIGKSNLWKLADNTDGSARGYFRWLRLAKAGITFYPIGLLHDLETHRYYCVEEFVDDIEYPRIIGNQFALVFARIGMSFGERLDELKIIAERLGIFAARLDKAGIGLDDRRFTLGKMIERENGDLILANYDIISDEPVRTPKDVVLEAVKKQFRQGTFTYDLYREDVDTILQTAEEGFNKGYYGEERRGQTPDEDEGTHYGAGAAGVNEKFGQGESDKLIASIKRLCERTCIAFSDELAQALMRAAVAEDPSPQEYADLLIANTNDDEIRTALTELLELLQVTSARHNEPKDKPSGQHNYMDDVNKKEERGQVSTLDKRVEGKEEPTEGGGRARSARHRPGEPNELYPPYDPNTAIFMPSGPNGGATDDRFARQLQQPVSNRYASGHQKKGEEPAPQAETTAPAKDLGGTTPKGPSPNEIKSIEIITGPALKVAEEAQGLKKLMEPYLAKAEWMIAGLVPQKPLSDNAKAKLEDLERCMVKMHKEVLNKLYDRLNEETFKAKNKNLKTLLNSLCGTIGHHMNKRIDEICNLSRDSIDTGFLTAEQIAEINKCILHMRKVLDGLSSLTEVHLQKIQTDLYRDIYVPGVRAIESFSYVMSSFTENIALVQDMQRTSATGASPLESAQAASRLTEFQNGVFLSGASPEGATLRDEKGKELLSSILRPRAAGEENQLFGGIMMFMPCAMDNASRNNGKNNQETKYDIKKINSFHKVNISTLIRFVKGNSINSFLEKHHAFNSLRPRAARERVAQSGTALSVDSGFSELGEGRASTDDTRASPSGKISVRKEFEFNPQAHLFPYQLLEAVSSKIGGPLGIIFQLEIKKKETYRPLPINAMSLLSEGSDLASGAIVRLTASASDSADPRLNADDVQYFFNIAYDILISRDAVSRDKEPFEYRDQVNRRVQARIDEIINNRASPEGATLQDEKGKELLSSILRPLATWERRSIEKIAKRESMLLEYGVYTPEELKERQELYRKFESDQDMALLTSHQKIFLWQYMILTHLVKINYELFDKLNTWIKEQIVSPSPNFEIEGLYIGFVWYSVIEAKDKVRTVVRNKLIPARKAVRVLDAGCGDGAVIIELAKQFPMARFVGIDANPVNLARALDKLIEMKENRPRNVKLHIRDFRNPITDERIPNRGIPYSNDAFDVAFLFEGVMDDDTYRNRWRTLVADEVVRVVNKNGGKIIFYGVRGEDALAQSIQKSDVGVDKTIGLSFYMNGNVRTRFRLPWSRMSDPPIELTVWELNRQKQQAPVPQAPVAQPRIRQRMLFDEACGAEKCSI